MLSGSGTMTFQRGGSAVPFLSEAFRRFVGGPATNYGRLQSIHVVMDDGQKT
jgi:hypothetical protein